MTIWLYVALGVYAALCIIPVAFVGGLVSMIEYDFPSGGHLSLLLLLRDLVVVALVVLAPRAVTKPPIISGCMPQRSAERERFGFCGDDLVPHPRIRPGPPFTNADAPGM